MPRAMEAVAQEELERLAELLVLLKQANAAGAISNYSDCLQRLLGKAVAMEGADDVVRLLCVAGAPGLEEGVPFEKQECCALLILFPDGLLADDRSKASTCTPSPRVAAELGVAEAEALLWKADLALGEATALPERAREGCTTFTRPDTGPYEKASAEALAKLVERRKILDAIDDPFKAAALGQRASFVNPLAAHPPATLEMQRN
eukprot:CAMPEP_0170154698 /NCGR_PEP_ID=MMETSP0033_2-20121228/58618_1 /TAXON_ID=195969 /ORGANISM="Dolichomastix tenuilepis, Strain CCMP3274" /LENGTH=204 /DNA_ID=CAMNT_0010391969 /DNA_START=236 /DNA_END=850 /DNA_ORIENTATION=+